VLFRSWICSFRQFSVIPPGIIPRGPGVIATQNEDLRTAREDLLAQVEDGPDSA
jgi:hypothetical protein